MVRSGMQWWYLRRHVGHVDLCAMARSRAASFDVAASAMLWE